MMLAENKMKHHFIVTVQIEFSIIFLAVDKISTLYKCKEASK
jgi:hypothetical protein